MILFIKASAVTSEKEILDAIPKGVLSAIRAHDPKPYFRAFTICHEGVATPMGAADGSETFVKRVIRVTKEAVKSLAARIADKPYYDDYHKQGSDRSEIGREVAQFFKEIDGNTHAISIVYGPPETRERLQQKTAVSMEAPHAKVIDGVLQAIDDISAFATGRIEDGDSPAWAGATFAGEIYAFSARAEDKEETMPDEVKNNGPRPAFNIGLDGMPDVQSMPLPVAEHIIKSIMEGKRLLPSQFTNWDKLFGKKKTGADGSTVWLGGDEKLREELLEHENGISGSYKKEIEGLKRFRTDVIDLRKQSFREGLMAQAKAEAEKVKFDEGLTKILMARMEELDPTVSEDILLESDKTKREAALGLLATPIVAQTVEKVRKEWAIKQESDAAASGTNGTGAPQNQGGGQQVSSRGW